MKVAVVFHELTPEAGGGFTFQESLRDAIESARGSSRHDFELYTTGLADPGPGFTRIPSGTTSALRRRAGEVAYDVQRTLLQAPAPQGWLSKRLVGNGTDIAWFATNYAEPVDVPYIFTVWDVEYMRQPWFPEFSGGQWEERDRYYNRYLTKATRVIVPNSAGTEQLLRYFRLDRERILELPHPTPPLAAAPPEGDAQLRERLGVKEPYIFYPAQFWPHKNHAVLLEALAELPDLRLVLTGSDKGGLDAVRARARTLGVDDRVQMLGFVENDALIALYRGAEALVYASVFGPENMPPLEAFALGCPVVAADIPGAREQMADGALLVPPTDASAWARAVTSVREDAKLREKLIDAGRARAAELTPERYVNGVLAFLDEFERVRSNWS